MDNSIISNIKRGLKVTSNYFISLVLFVIFTLPIITVAEENSPSVLAVFSFFVFLALFYMVYVEMRVIAFKEKRPQYNINPSPYKGLLYGLIGIIPLVVCQIILTVIKIPEQYVTLKRRLYQGFSGPLYWLANLLGNDSIHYVISFLVLIIIAGLGYYAGYKEFYLFTVIRNKLGIKPKRKV